MLLWAALQLALPGVASLADAIASRDGASATVHIEDASGASCVRVHDTECVFCQFLTACASPAGSPAPEFVAAARAESLETGGLAPGLDARHGALLPRAPPQA
jgi:hypothetical protein